jgi:GNAT superfamily N-acetyltransferase
LLSHLERLASCRGCELIKCSTLDSDDVSRSFLENRGYRYNSHAFSSTLDLDRFDARSYASKPADNCLRIFTFAETAQDDRAKRKLWALNVDSCLDEPNNNPPFSPPFEAYARQVLGAPWFNPAFQVIAAVDEEWVGVSAIGEMSPGDLHNLYTGVRREFRGRGIARALKVHALSLAKNGGYKTIRTGNDSRNAPMLEVNRQLGYVAKAGMFEFRKTLNAR